LPAGFVPPTLPWFAMVAKLVPVALLFASQGIAPDPKIGEGFVTGTVAATLFSLVEARWRGQAADGSDPRSEFKSLWRGASNGPAYAVAMTVATALALLAAMQIGASRPIWAFVTVLFVMHPQGVAVVKRLRAMAVFALRHWHAWRGTEPSKSSDGDAVEPAHVGVAGHDGGAAEPGVHF